MTDNHIISIRDTVKMTSILTLLILGAYVQDSHFTMLAFWWTLTLLILGNVRRISYAGSIPYFVRMTLYFLPYALPVLFVGGISNTVNSKVLYSCIVALLFFAFWVVLNRKSIKIMISNQFIAESAKESRYKIGLHVYNLMGAAICEEMFFRQYILKLNGHIIVLSIISVVFFVLSHWLLPWGQRFSANDLMNQALFGIVSVLLFIYSDSIIPCLVLHFSVNLISIIKYAKIYDRHYVRVEKYDKLLCPQAYPELDL